MSTAVYENTAETAKRWRFKPIYISLLLFFAALNSPVDIGPEFASQTGEDVITLGWSYFLWSFIGLGSIIQVLENPASFFTILSGALTNVLLILGWVKFSAWKHKPILVWTSGTAFLLSFAPLTYDFLHVGYWLWVSAAGAQFITVLKTRNNTRQENAPVTVTRTGIEPGSSA